MTIVLKGILAGLTRLGYIENVHYVVGRKTPKGWQRPIEPPVEWSHTIHFRNGAIVQMLSQRAKSTGISLDALIVDEADKLNMEIFMEDFWISVSGNNNRFDSWLHHSRLICCNQPKTSDGFWLNRWQRDSSMFIPDDTSEEVARRMRPCFLLADTFENRENLGEDYFSYIKMMLPPPLYNADILNIEVKVLGASFYPYLNDAHKYDACNVDTYYNEYDKALTKGAFSDMEIINDWRGDADLNQNLPCLLYTSPSPRDLSTSRMPSSA